MSTQALDSKLKIIVALDCASRAEAGGLLHQLGNRTGYFKIGLQLFVAEGPDIVKAVQDSGARVFLDLKFHDIPNTVCHAVESAMELGVDMLTIHAGGGAPMAEAAVAGRGDATCTLLGVTVLTSMERAVLESVGVQGAVEDQVLRLAHVAKQGGLTGVVASPLELGLLRQVFGPEFVIVTPGVRPAGADTNDQKRILTLRQAIDAGASHLVIGRPITAAQDPAVALEKIMEEIQ